MKVTLVTYTKDPVKVCAEAAAICTDAKDPMKALRAAMESGHDSVLEHASFTFKLEGVSRVVVAQIPRHRIASYSVRSGRYCEDSRQFNLPDTISPEDVDTPLRLLYDYYDMLLMKGVPQEDARYILPQGATTNMMATMNARELRHFFALRCCNRAQRETRLLALDMLRLVKEVAPELFVAAGPGCVRGACPEKHSCRNPYDRETINKEGTAKDGERNDG